MHNVPQILVLNFRFKDCIEQTNVFLRDNSTQVLPDAVIMQMYI